MLKYILVALLTYNLSGLPGNKYPWLHNEPANETIASLIKVPAGYKRIEVESNSFADWLRHLPLKPAGTPVKLWNGKLKPNQGVHVAVVNLDFIGGNIQQCIDAIIRLRSEYLWSVNRADEIKFSYTCCNEKIPWEKWKIGWRTKIVKKNGLDAFVWEKTAEYDDSRINFISYLCAIMFYAGTQSLSTDMKKIGASDVQIGDAWVQGGAPGYGHGVLIVDMAVSPTGKKIMLLGQSYTPAENFNILKSYGRLSPWFECDFGDELITPQWIFKKEHARRF